MKNYTCTCNVYNDVHIKKWFSLTSAPISYTILLYRYTFIQFSSVLVIDDMAFIINSVVVPDFRDALLMSCITMFSVNNLKRSWKTGTEIKKCRHR